jgi:hypothetical protein
LAASAGATTTDHRDQALANVLTDAPDRFWSSTGEAVTLPEFPWAAASEERLTFVLASCGGGGGANSGAAALTGGVTIRAYRATFQPGHPVYPPLKVQIWLGASLASLKPAGPWLPFWPSAAAQSFPVAAASAAGGGGARVLQIRLRGRPQWQLEDLRFYVALQYCGASGVLLPPATALPSPAARNASVAALGPADSELPPLLRWWGGCVSSGAAPALIDRTGGRAQAAGDGFWREGWRQQQGEEDEGMEEAEAEEDARAAPAAAAPLQGAIVVDASLAP